MAFQPTKKTFPLVLAALSIRSTKEEKLSFSKKNSSAQKWIVCVAKDIAGMTNISAAKISKKNAWRLWWWLHLEVFQGFEEVVNVTSTNRGIRTTQHAVATYELTKKGLSYFLSSNKCSTTWNPHSSLSNTSIDSSTKCVNSYGWHIFFAFVVTGNLYWNFLYFKSISSNSIKSKTIRRPYN